MNIIMSTTCRKVLDILEETPIGNNSMYFLTKQCEDTGIRMDTIEKKDIERLVERLSGVLPLFIGSKSPGVIENISTLAEVHKPSDKETIPFQIVEREKTPGGTVEIGEKEGEEKKENEVVLTKGQSYLVIEKHAERSMKLFANMVSLATPGLCITRTYPEELKDTHNLGETPVYWLSRASGKNVVAPSNVEILLNLIETFLGKNNNSIVVIDGLEYLVTYNNFTTILKFVHELKDLMAVTRSILLVPVSPDALSQDKIALMERDMNIIAK